MIDWSNFLSSSLDYLVVYVDGRGTGFKGREFRVGVRNQLGKLEALDVSTAAQLSPPPMTIFFLAGRPFFYLIWNCIVASPPDRYYAGLKYVDPERIGIWGWSCESLVTFLPFR
jgi:dipeptidyl aminopeptidase